MRPSISSLVNEFLGIYEPTQMIDVFFLKNPLILSIDFLIGNSCKNSKYPGISPGYPIILPQEFNSTSSKHIFYFIQTYIFSGNLIEIIIVPDSSFSIYSRIDIEMIDKCNIESYAYSSESSSKKSRILKCLLDISI
jgi:hypothetical protein